MPTNDQPQDAASGPVVCSVFPDCDHPKCQQYVYCSNCSGVGWIPSTRYSFAGGGPGWAPCHTCNAPNKDYKYPEPKVGAGHEDAVRLAGLERLERDAAASLELDRQSADQPAVPDDAKLTDAEIWNAWLKEASEWNTDEEVENMRRKQHIQDMVIKSRRSSATAGTEKAWHARDVEVAELQAQLSVAKLTTVFQWQFNVAIKQRDAAREQVRVLVETLEILIKECRRMWPHYQVGGDEDHSIAQAMRSGDALIAAAKEATADHYPGNVH